MFFFFSVTNQNCFLNYTRLLSTMSGFRIIQDSTDTSYNSIDIYHKLGSFIKVLQVTASSFIVYIINVCRIVRKVIICLFQGPL